MNQVRTLFPVKHQRIPFYLDFDTIFWPKTRILYPNCMMELVADNGLNEFKSEIDGAL